jgi:hypothetical protein
MALQTARFSATTQFPRPRGRQRRAVANAARFLAARFLAARFLAARFLAARFLAARFLAARFLAARFLADVGTTRRMTRVVRADGAVSRCRTAPVVANAIPTDLPTPATCQPVDLRFAPSCDLPARGPR